MPRGFKNRVPMKTPGGSCSAAGVKHVSFWGKRMGTGLMVHNSKIDPRISAMESGDFLILSPSYAVASLS